MKPVSIIASVVVCFGIVLNAAADEPKPVATPADFRWVPEQWVIFGHIRLGEILNTPAGKAIHDYINAVEPTMIPELEQSLGMQLSEIDQISLVLPELDLHAIDKDAFVIRVVTRNPYDRRKVLEALAATNRSPGKIDPNKTVHEFGHGTGLVNLTNNKTLTFFIGPGAAKQRANLLQVERSGKLDPKLLELIKTNPVVGAVDGPRLREPVVGKILKDFRPLFDVRQAILTGCIKADRIELGLQGEFENDAEFRAAHNSLLKSWDELLRLGKLFSQLATARHDIAAKTMLDAVLAGLKEGQIDSDGLLLTVKARVSTDGFVKLMQKDGARLIKLAGMRDQATRNLKMIGLAMHNYASVNTYLPPAAICDKNGKPLLSWRVAILPFIEEQNLYTQFHLDEPWDSEHNKKLISRMPKAYVLPGDNAKHEMPSTYYRMFVGNNAITDWRRGRSLEQITSAGGCSNTIMVVESADAVPWTKPEELEYDPNKPVKLGYHFENTANVAMADGAVRVIRKGIKDEVLHDAIQYNSEKRLIGQILDPK
jgi:hypothetical protein